MGMVTVMGHTEDHAGAVLIMGLLMGDPGGTAIMGLLTTDQASGAFTEEVHLLRGYVAVLSLESQRAAAHQQRHCMVASQRWTPQGSPWLSQRHR